MIQKDADDYNLTMQYASRMGHFKIIELMLQLRADNYDICMSEAEDYEHDNISSLIIKR